MTERYFTTYYLREHYGFGDQQCVRLADALAIPRVGTGHSRHWTETDATAMVVLASLQGGRQTPPGAAHMAVIIARLAVSGPLSAADHPAVAWCHPVGTMAHGELGDVWKSVRRWLGEGHHVYYLNLALLAALRADPVDAEVP
jgi:hypothetical protein